MDNTTKFYLFLDCHLVVTWTALCGTWFSWNNFWLALVATFLTAWFMYRLMKRVISVYARATINSIIAYAEATKEDTPE